MAAAVSSIVPFHVSHADLLATEDEQAEVDAMINHDRIAMMEVVEEDDEDSDASYHGNEEEGEIVEVTWPTHERLCGLIYKNVSDMQVREPPRLFCMLLPSVTDLLHILYMAMVPEFVRISGYPEPELGLNNLHLTGFIEDQVIGLLCTGHVPRFHWGMLMCAASTYYKTYVNSDLHHKAWADYFAVTVVDVVSLCFELTGNGRTHGHASMDGWPDILQLIHHAVPDMVHEWMQQLDERGCGGNVVNIYLFDRAVRSVLRVCAKLVLDVNMDNIVDNALPVLPADEFHALKHCSSRAINTLRYNTDI